MFVIEVDHIIKQSFAIEIFHKRRHQRMVQRFYACVDMMGMLRDQNVKSSIQWPNVLLEMGKRIHKVNLNLY